MAALSTVLPICNLDGCGKSLQIPIQCSRCLYVPTSDNDPTWTAVGYCKIEHLVADTVAHEPKCKQRQQERTAKRVGMFCCRAFLAMQQEFHRKVLESWERVNIGGQKGIILREKYCAQPRALEASFASNVPVWIREVSCSFEWCRASIADQTPLLSWLQKELNIRIDEVTVIPKITRRTMVISRWPGMPYKKLVHHSGSHTILAVRTDPENNSVVPTGNIWPHPAVAIDVTKQQFGYKSGCKDAGNYYQRKVDELLQVVPLGDCYKGEDMSDPESRIVMQTLNNVTFQELQALGGCRRFFEDTTPRKFERGLQRIFRALRNRCRTRRRDMDAIQFSRSFETDEERDIKLGRKLERLAKRTNGRGHEVCKMAFEEHLGKVMGAGFVYPTYTEK